ncbi:hypothetical protein WOLCODRAFT_156482 [Wolfiporia cocos MD-104 SS10]|uniref:Uncharacterized protein n=1 Tax=Wolfiporia cocos (strain MD-104) TaxID=742152 RepID=A0A2H3JDN1_WOLCO|nr:hypothetical protein WOLCODRAFT_156482 [Wolfiporia cocos MD-104 SS10]
MIPADPIASAARQHNPPIATRSPTLHHSKGDRWPLVPQGEPIDDIDELQSERAGFLSKRTGASTVGGPCGSPHAHISSFPTLSAALEIVPLCVPRTHAVLVGGQDELRWSGFDVHSNAVLDMLLQNRGCDFPEGY